IEKPKHENCFLVLFFLSCQDCCEGRWLLASSKPGVDNVTGYARWLVSKNTWGVLKNVVSFCDGVPDESTGIPYFYLTTLDPTARNALKDHRFSLTLGHYPLGTCITLYPESPACAKITLTGKLVLPDANSKESEFAKAALFT
ncbi:hypothetical protein Gogos_020119, partial [Gossypium gossypioides]|nr:hypothetical protein [Gossypium gossypioides]